MLGRGTITHSAETFTRDFAQIGAGLSADAGREYTTVSSVFLARDFDTGIELVADAVTHPVFLDDEFRRAANQIGRGVVQLHQSPPATGVEQLWTLAWPELPVAAPGAGGAGRARRARGGGAALWGSSSPGGGAGGGGGAGRGRPDRPRARAWGYRGAGPPADSAATLARRLTAELKRFLFAPP